jgi:hypothetical protein
MLKCISYKETQNGRMNLQLSNNITTDIQNKKNIILTVSFYLQNPLLEAVTV